MFISDDGIIDGRMLGYSFSGGVALICLLGALLIGLKVAQQNEREENTALATSYIIKEAEVAIYLLFLGGQHCKTYGSGAWNNWYQTYMDRVHAHCSPRAWIDHTCVGRLPLMDHPAYMINEAYAKEISMKLGNANLMGKPLLPL